MPFKQQAISRSTPPSKKRKASEASEIDEQQEARPKKKLEKPLKPFCLKQLSNGRRDKKPLDYAGGRTAYSITLNKAHCTIIRIRPLDLETDCFSHGLYVACSRVDKPISSQTMEQQKYCIPTSNVKLNILETFAFSFLSFPFNQTEPQQRVAGY